MGTDSPKMTCFRLKVQPLLERLLRAPRVGRVSGLCQHFFVFLREREILPLRVGRVFAIANVGGNCDGLLSREGRVPPRSTASYFCRRNRGRVPLIERMGRGGTHSCPVITYWVAGASGNRVDRIFAHLLRPL